MLSTNSIERLRRCSPSRTVSIDTETTGLNKNSDEILSIALVDGSGRELFYSLVKPTKRKRWPDATKIHGITWNDVKDAPELLDLYGEIAPIINGADLVIGYNLEYDLGMIAAAGASLNPRATFDVMKEYSSIYGTWNEWRGHRQWMKLVDCAEHYGYEFSAHNALEDAKATAYCFNQLMNDENYYQESLNVEKEIEEQARAAKQAKRDRMAKIFFVIALFCAVGIVVELTNEKANAGGTVFYIVATTIFAILAWLFKRGGGSKQQKRNEKPSAGKRAGSHFK